MRTIGVTMEVTKRLYCEYVVTDEEFEAMKENASLTQAIGTACFNNLVDETSGLTNYEADYAVTDEDGVTILDWDP